jgi:hypothetical protein
MICSKCGENIQDSHIFCPKCGNTIETLHHEVVNSVSTPYISNTNTYNYSHSNTNNSKAVTSLVLGIISFSCCGLATGIPGIVIAIKSRKEIKSTGQSGDGMAVAGLTLSIIGTLWTVFIFIYFIFVWVVAYYTNTDFVEALDDAFI